MENNTPTTSSFNVNKLIVNLGLTAFAYFGVVNPLLKKIGIKDDAQDKRNNNLISDLENQPANKNYFNPNYYKQRVNNKVAMVFTPASGDMLAKKIYDSAGFFNDNESEIYGAFRQCRFKAQVSFIAARFYLLYKKDLYLWLKKDVFNESEMISLLNITDPLPPGFIN